MRIKYLVIHCTATQEGKEVTGADIRKWHLSPPPAGRGWRQVGYTDLIHLDGTVERLVQNNEDAKVDSWEITNGATGINNVSRHIVYAGGLSKDGKTAKDTRTPEQMKTLENYVRDFHRRFPFVEIKGHGEFDKNKECPSFDVQKWLKNIGI